jgi:hypothetical protein
LRLYGIKKADVRAVVAAPERGDVDSRGNPCLERTIDGRRIVVVVARDAPNLVWILRSWRRR